MLIGAYVAHYHDDLACYGRWYTLRKDDQIFRVTRRQNRAAEMTLARPKSMFATYGNRALDFDAESPSSRPTVDY